MTSGDAASGGAPGPLRGGAGGDEATVLVHEIFTSIQGETTAAGRPCTFVRLTGCDLRCRWCDTAYAFTGGTRRTVRDLVDDVRARGVGFVTVTGGEPLLQASCPALVRALLEAGHEVQVETGGHRDVAGLDPRARVIVDVKLPGSGEERSVRWDNIDGLRPQDEVKLVVASRADYEVAREVVRERLARFAGAILLQPVTGELSPTELAEWILADRLPVRLTVQLQALLWPGRTGV